MNRTVILAGPRLAHEEQREYNRRFHQSVSEPAPDYP